MKRVTKQAITSSANLQELSVEVKRKINRVIEDLVDIHEELDWSYEGPYITKRGSEILEKAEDILIEVVEKY